VVSAAENSNKFQKTRSWKEKSVENVVTLEGFLPFNSSIISFHIWLFKKSIHTLQNNRSHVEFPYFVMGSHLGPTALATFTLKLMLRQMKNYGNSNISPCKNVIFKKVL